MIDRALQEYEVLTAGIVPSIALSLAFSEGAIATYPHVLNILFYDPFADNNAGWTLGIEWQVGSAKTSSGQSYGNLNEAPTLTSFNSAFREDYTFSYGAPVPSLFALFFKDVDGDSLNCLSFSWNASDGAMFAATSAIANLFISPEPDAPTVGMAIANQTTTEDHLFSFTLPATTFTDADGDRLTYTRVSLITLLFPGG